MKQKIFLTPFLIIIFTSFVFSQEIPDKQATEKEKFAELESKAVKMLKETAGEIESLRTIGNKISFSTEMANLMWFHDEREARKMFESVIANFVNLLSQYNAEIGLLNNSGETMEMYAVRNLPSVNGEKNPYLKLFEALTIRRQIALSIAEHDAELAFAFVKDTAKVITNEDFKNGPLGSESDFEEQIINVMSVKNTDSAVRIGKEKLKDGYSSALLSLAQKIYAKDEQKGRDFAGDIVYKIKTDKSKTETYELISVLNFGKGNIEEVKKNPDKKSLFSESDLRDIAEILAQNLLSVENLGEYSIETFVELIKPFSPSRAAQIQAKYDRQTANDKTEVDSMELASNKPGNSVYAGNTASNEEILTPQQKALADKRKNQETLLEELGSFKTITLPAEERA
ncbi:MAG: hypothetical protein ACR2J3_04340, partial [Aridibacter sp.]